MTKAQHARARQLVNLQRQLFNIEKRKIHELQSRRRVLEAAEEEALALLGQFSPTPRLGRAIAKTAAHLRLDIEANAAAISAARVALTKRALSLRLAERLAQKRKERADIEAARAELAEITEAAVRRSSFK